MNLLKRKANNRAAEPEDTLEERFEEGGSDMSAFLGIGLLKNLRFAPMPEWVVTKGSEVFCVSSADPLQKYWKPCEPEECGVEPQPPFKLWRRIPTEASLSPRRQEESPLPAFLVSSVTLNTSETVMIRKNILCRATILTGDTKLASSIVKMAGKEMRTLEKTAVWLVSERCRHVDSFSEFLAVASTASMRKHGNFVLLANYAQKNSMWTDDDLAVCDENDNLGMLSVQFSDYSRQKNADIVDVSYQGMSLEGLSPAANTLGVFHPPPMDGIRDGEDNLKMLVKSRPGLKAQGLQRSPSVTPKMVELLYLIMMLTEAEEPTTAKVLAGYMESSSRRDDSEDFVESIARSTAERLGMDIKGKPRMWRDGAGNWHHSIGLEEGDSDSLLDDTDWRWLNQIEVFGEKALARSSKGKRR